MAASLHLGLWQSAGTPGDITANLAEVRRAADEAASAGVELLVLPECFLTGYFTDGDVAETAQRVGRQVHEDLASVAASTGVALVVGSYESDGAHVYNSAFVILPDTGLAGTYRKRALFGTWERAVFTPGRAPFLFDYKGVRIGLNICYDIEFPERVRELALGGADVVLCPTAVMAPYDMVPRHIVPARAFENHLFVAYANRIGVEGPYAFIGQSRIADPLGRVSAAAGAEPALVHAVLDMALRDTARADYDYLSDLAHQE
ncbi:carbon-nitrogen hydrolase family protein [Sulfitobacter sp. D35]|uniref:carbon-nitrogen hydrolase family protein n=1 Tax=Sulfitobacter sp. D35 TaxID=3083252 RepID=UPI00296F4A15|nr:carbon-nitrogen hydrolase family protein [Sulfitobacter sp. D35]MDW4497955.1 carbon-nitrogen hydrolase family protein [Sulfitobacter sp. D35]